MKFQKDQISYNEQIHRQLPMTNMEIDIIRSIYYIRLKIFGVSFLLFCFISIYANASSASRMAQYIQGKDFFFLFNLEIIIASIFISIAAIWIYYKKIRPYALDLKYGMKEQITYTIIMKRAFPIGTYYLGLNHPIIYFIK